MPYAEFVSQMAFYRLFPWGDDWRQVRALHATILSASPKFRHFNLERYFPQSPLRSGDNLGGMFESFRDIALEQKSRGHVR